MASKYQDEQKRMKADAHRRMQKHKKDNALITAEDAALHLGKNGKRLKRARTTPDQDIFESVMRDHGYVPNGKGGWRRLVHTASKTDPVAKER